MPPDHWENLYRSWAQLKVPRPTSTAAFEATKAEVASAEGCVLLFGFTPALADGSTDLVAIDQNAKLAKSVWPGNTERRRAVIGQWMHLPFADETFGACMGDGILSTLEYPVGLDRLMQEIVRVTRPGGKFVGRVFACPDRTNSLAEIRETTFAGRTSSFQVLKFLVAMSAARNAGGPNIPVASIAQAFDATFTDRAALAAATGWELAEINTIDVYRPSTAIYSFPTRSEYLSRVPAAFGTARFLEGIGNYPLLILENRA